MMPLDLAIKRVGWTFSRCGRSRPPWTPTQARKSSLLVRRPPDSIRMVGQVLQPLETREATLRRCMNRRQLTATLIGLTKILARHLIIFHLNMVRVKNELILTMIFLMRPLGWWLKNLWRRSSLMHQISQLVSLRSLTQWRPTLKIWDLH